jgi:hypothetical protein
MAVPDITISLKPINSLNLTNTEAYSSSYKLYKLNDGGSDFITYDDDTEHIIESEETIITDLSEDNLYKIAFIDDETLTYDWEFYILADHNIKLCNKTLIKSILCVPAKDCDTKAYYKLLEKRQRFAVLKEAIYAVFSKYIDGLNQNNLGYDDILSVRANYRIYLNSLSDMCGCTNIKIDNCASGELPTTNWTNLSSTDCGCN